MSKIDVEYKGSGKKQSTQKRGASIWGVSMTIAGLVLIVSYLQYSELTESLPWLDNRNVPSTGAVLIVVVMHIINSIVKRTRGTTVFWPQDMVFAFAVISISGLVGSWGLMAVAFGNMAALPLLAMQHPSAYKPILELVSKLVYIDDRYLAREFWVGTGSYHSVPWRAWISPAICWAIFWSALFFTLLCIMTLFRKHWTERERLMFPMTVPISILIGGSTDDKEDKPIWNNRLLWVGMAFPMMIYASSLSNYFFPVIPAISTQLDLGRYFTEPPWSALQNWPGFVLSFRPLVIGIGYLLSSEVAFSVWFFFLLNKLRSVLFESIGVGPIISTFSIMRGAFVGIAFYYTWLARHDIVEILKISISRKQIDRHRDSDEPVSYRVSVLGIIGGLTIVTLFSVYLLGMTVLVIALYFIIFFGVALGFARFRAESGVPSAAAGMEFGEADVERLFGKRVGSVDQLGISHFYNPMGNGWFAGIPAYFLEFYKLADNVKLKPKSLTKGLLLGFVITFLVSMVVGLPIIYNYGMFNLSAFSNTHGMLSYAHYEAQANRSVQVSYVIGMFASFVLMWLRTTFPWWSLTATGFAFAFNTQATFIAGEFFIAWIIKTLVFRFGGYSAYKRLVPVFMGFVLGQMGMSAIVSVIRILSEVLLL